MHSGGKEYRRLVGAFERIFGATIFFGTDSFGGKATMIQRSRFNFMREAQIWYSREHPDQRTLSSEFENIIVLSDEFYQELIAHPVPNDLAAIKVLAASGRPGRLHVAVISMLHREGHGVDTAVRRLRAGQPDRHN